MKDWDQLVLLLDQNEQPSKELLNNAVLEVPNKMQVYPYYILGKKQQRIFKYLIRNHVWEPSQIISFIESVKSVKNKNIQEALKDILALAVSTHWNITDEIFLFVMKKQPSWIKQIFIEHSTIAAKYPNLVTSFLQKQKKSTEKREDLLYKKYTKILEDPTITGKKYVRGRLGKVQKMVFKDLVQKKGLPYTSEFLYSWYCACKSYGLRYITIVDQFYHLNSLINVGEAIAYLSWEKKLHIFKCSWIYSYALAYLPDDNIVKLMLSSINFQRDMAKREYERRKRLGISIAPYKTVEKEVSEPNYKEEYNELQNK